MKISHDVLIYKIWLAQLKKLSSGVLHRYIGGGVGVCCEDWLMQSSSVHIVERKKITDEIGPQQLRKRIIELIDDEVLIWTHRNCTFMLNTKQAEQAFISARDFMLSKGIPTGWDGERECMRTVKVDDVEALTSECHQHLLQHFKQINWSQAYREVEAA
jgi:hypothetical protein